MSHHASPTTAGSIDHRHAFVMSAEAIDAIDEMEEIETETSWQEFYMEIDAWATRALPSIGFGDI